MSSIAPLKCNLFMSDLAVYQNLLWIWMMYPHNLHMNRSNSLALNSHKVDKEIPEVFHSGRRRAMCFYF